MTGARPAPMGRKGRDSKDSPKRASLAATGQYVSYELARTGEFARTGIPATEGGGARRLCGLLKAPAVHRGTR
jgi:hypothetical protein